MSALILMNAWIVAGLAAALYCFARGIVDLRQRRFVWGALGILSGVIIMSTPIQSRPFKFELLPSAANSQG